jgi:electron transport complex protein RnfB
MHVVLDDACTGCALCLPPCPVDCIVLVPAGAPWGDARARRARSAFEARLLRRARAPVRSKSDRRASRAAAEAPPQAQTDPATLEERQRRERIVAAALARARARRPGVS